MDMKAFRNTINDFEVFVTKCPCMFCFLTTSITLIVMLIWAIFGE